MKQKEILCLVVAFCLGYFLSNMMKANVIEGLTDCGGTPVPQKDSHPGHCANAFKGKKAGDVSLQATTLCGCGGSSSSCQKTCKDLGAPCNPTRGQWCF